MVFASYFVLDALYRSLDNEDDIVEIREVFEKFSQRYSEDDELKKIYEYFMTHYPHVHSTKELEKLKTKLKKLSSVRKLSTLKSGNICNFLQ